MIRTNPTIYKVNPLTSKFELISNPNKNNSNNNQNNQNNNGIDNPNDNTEQILEEYETFIIHPCNEIIEKYTNHLNHKTMYIFAIVTIILVFPLLMYCILPPLLFKSDQLLWYYITFPIVIFAYIVPTIIYGLKKRREIVKAHEMTKEEITNILEFERDRFTGVNMVLDYKEYIHGMWGSLEWRYLIESPKITIYDKYQFPVVDNNSGEHHVRPIEELGSRIFNFRSQAIKV
ncbi:hypothetical protein ABK040_013446 [Willaertia magna]